MRDPVPSQPFDDEESAPRRHASFILRCWTTEAGQTRARLIDVASGVSRPVADLADLPGLVRRLVAQGLYDEEDTR